MLKTYRVTFVYAGNYAIEAFESGKVENNMMIERRLNNNELSV